jgi:hypothetical protein
MACSEEQLLFRVDMMLCKICTVRDGLVKIPSNLSILVRIIWLINHRPNE